MSFSAGGWKFSSIRFRSGKERKVDGVNEKEMSSFFLDYCCCMFVCLFFACVYVSAFVSVCVSKRLYLSESVCLRVIEPECLCSRVLECF